MASPYAPTRDPRVRRWPGYLAAFIAFVLFGALAALPWLAKLASVPSWVVAGNTEFRRSRHWLRPRAAERPARTGLRHRRAWDGADHRPCCRTGAGEERGQPDPQGPARGDQDRRANGGADRAGATDPDPAGAAESRTPPLISCTRTHFTSCPMVAVLSWWTASSSATAGR